MPRANRFHLPGYVWHLTHRCHRGDFLLKFARDRRLWVSWLSEARRRFGLCVLNYQATSNHVHLVVRDRDQQEIAHSMQLLEGCTAAAYNRRKKRLGGYWQDRYSATAVETGEHLWNCLTYVGLNMVRAGVVSHPRDWPHTRFHEILRPRKRYRIIDREALCEALEIDHIAALAEISERAVEDAIARGSSRDDRWTRSVAVGSKDFVERVAQQLGVRALYRNIHDLGDEGFALRDLTIPYKGLSAPEIATLSQNSAQPSR